MLLYVADEYDERSEHDIFREGHYAGAVSDTLFRKLEKELADVGIDTLKFGEGYSDYPFIRIIVYYNGKRRLIEGKGAPESASNLLSTLYQICKKSKVDRIYNSYWFEGEIIDAFLSTGINIRNVK
jgi:hypothetical protein